MLGKSLKQHAVGFTLAFVLDDIYHSDWEKDLYDVCVVLFLGVCRHDMKVNMIGETLLEFKQILRSTESERKDQK